MDPIYKTDYAAIPASASKQKLSESGGKAGDVLCKLVVAVITAATGTVTLNDSDGGPNIPLVPANTPVGLYTILLDARSNQGGWRITTGAGATVVATGRFQ